MEELIGKDQDPEIFRLSGEVIGAAIEVHRALGPGFLESAYQQAMCIELASRGVEFICEHRIPVEYKGQVVGEGRADLLVGQKLIVELKAVDGLAPIHTAQVISYLRATNLRVGLVVNFNVKVLKDGIKRVAL